jgi:glycosyltransferase involved in cell wall biosynthesis
LKATVVICTYSVGRKLWLKDAVASVLAQSYTKNEVIVLVDALPELIGQLRASLPPVVSIVVNEKLGDQAAARNLGMQRAQGDVVAYLDDDAVAETEWLSALMAHFSKPQVLAVGGQAVPVWETGGRPFWIPEELDWIVGGTYRGYSERSGPVRNIHGHNMAFRREVLIQVGGFQVGRVGGDPITADGDDAELCLRIRTARPEGIIYFEPRAIIYHRVPCSKTSVIYLLRKSYGQGAGKALIRAVHSANADALSSERKYALHLVTSFLPDVWRGIGTGHVLKSLAQLGALVLSTSSVIAGFSFGMLRRKLGGSPPKP